MEVRENTGVYNIENAKLKSKEQTNSAFLIEYCQCMNLNFLIVEILCVS